MGLEYFLGCNSQGGVVIIKVYQKYCSVHTCFLQNKTGNQWRTASLAGEAMTRDNPLFKMAISLDLNIWDNVRTQVSKINNTVPVILGYFN